MLQGWLILEVKEVLNCLGLYFWLSQIIHCKISDNCKGKFEKKLDDDRGPFWRPEDPQPATRSQTWTDSPSPLLSLL